MNDQGSSWTPWHFALYQTMTNLNVTSPEINTDKRREHYFKYYNC